MSRIVSLPRSSEEIWKVGKNTLAVIKEENYHDEQNKNNILKLRKILDTLPSFCKDFFRGIEPYTSTRTRLAYAYDIRLFFEFLETFPDRLLRKRGDPKAVDRAFTTCLLHDPALDQLSLLAGITAVNDHLGILHQALDYLELLLIRRILD